MNALTVWSVCVGTKYDSGYVYALREAVAKHLTIPHEFRCITTRNLPDIQTVKPPVPYQSWWSKMGLFYPGIATGPSLYFDLDVVITGNLDYLADYTDTFSAPANWAQSGHGGIQSSVMAWPGNWHAPYEKIRQDWPNAKWDGGYMILNGKRLWGDQEYLYDMLDNDWRRIPGIGSYKYHIRPIQQIPDWMSVCVFHGKPDPHEVSDKCLSPYISTHVINIRRNTDVGYSKASSDII